MGCPRSCQPLMLLPRFSGAVPEPGSNGRGSLPAIPPQTSPARGRTGKPGPSLPPCQCSAKGLRLRQRIHRGRAHANLPGMDADHVAKVRASGHPNVIAGPESSALPTPPPIGSVTSTAPAFSRLSSSPAARRTNALRPVVSAHVQEPRKAAWRNSAGVRGARFCAISAAAILFAVGLAAGVGAVRQYLSRSASCCGVTLKRNRKALWHRSRC